MNYWMEEFIRENEREMMREMKPEQVYKDVEKQAKSDRIMEEHYGVKTFPANEPYFTTSQETDIREMISDGLTSDEIIKAIKKW